MQVSRFQGFIEYLLDNLFDIATIVVAGYLVIRHQVQPFAPNDIAELATWILAVLGLIAVSGLWDRNRRLHRIEKLSEESRDLVLRRLSGKVHANDFFLSGHQLSNQVFESATTIWLSGVTLSRTTRSYMHILSQRLVEGVQIRIILVDPAVDVALQELALQDQGSTTVEFWRNRLQTVQTIIEIIGKTPNNKGSLEIGYLPYTPSFGLVITDPFKPHGFCSVELYCHKSTETNPAFELRASDDPRWYEFFRRQYEDLWRSCRTEQLSSTVLSPSGS
jgi:hypothetical protein